MDKKTSKKISKKTSKKTSKKSKLCCQSTEKDKKCIRKSDEKEFDIEKRRFSKKTCLTKPIKGFTMKSSCAPYKDCKKK
jgi:hypothetical protein